MSQHRRLLPLSLIDADSTEQGPPCEARCVWRKMASRKSNNLATARLLTPSVFDIGLRIISHDFEAGLFGDIGRDKSGSTVRTAWQMIARLTSCESSAGRSSPQAKLSHRTLSPPSRCTQRHGWRDLTTAHCLADGNENKRKQVLKQDLTGCFPNTHQIP